MHAALAELSHRALTAKNLGLLTDEAVAVAVRTLKVEYGAMFELRTDGDALLLRAGVGWTAGVVGHLTIGARDGSHVSRALDGDEPVVLDVLAEPPLAGDAFLREHGVITGVTAALRRGTGAFGFVGVYSTHPRRFDRNERYFLADIANILALAIERGRAEATTHALAEVGRDLSASLDPAGVARSAVDSLCKLLNAPMAVLYRLDPDSGDLVSAAVSDAAVQAHGRDIVLPKDQGGASALAIRDRCAVTSPDVITDPRVTLPQDLNHQLHRSDYRAVLAAPLIIRDGAAGGVLVVGDRTGRVFTADEIILAQAFADQVAVAFENARRHAETEQRLRETDSYGP